MDDVEVVDHQVEDDANVGGAEPERAEAVAFDEDRLEAVAGDRLVAGVEALDVADLEPGAALRRGGDEVARVLDAVGHGLLDEDGDAAPEERQRDGVMVERGDDDADGLRAVEQEVRRLGPFGLEFPGDGARRGGVAVHDADQLGIRQPGVDAGVLLAEMADADDAHLESAHATPPRSCRVTSRYRASLPVSERRMNSRRFCAGLVSRPAASSSFAALSLESPER